MNQLSHIFANLMRMVDRRGKRVPGENLNATYKSSVARMFSSYNYTATFLIKHRAEAEMPAWNFKLVQRHVVF